MLKQAKKHYKNEIRQNQYFSRFTYVLCATSIIYNVGRIYRTLKICSYFPDETIGNVYGASYLLLNIFNTQFFIRNCIWALYYRFYNPLIENYQLSWQNVLWTTMVALQLLIPNLTLPDPTVLPFGTLCMELLFIGHIMLLCKSVNGTYISADLGSKFYERMLNIWRIDDAMKALKNAFKSDNQKHENNIKKKTASRGKNESTESTFLTGKPSSSIEEVQQKRNKEEAKRQKKAQHKVEVFTVQQQENSNNNLDSFNITTEKQGNIFITSLKPGALLYDPNIPTFVMNISPQCRGDFDKILSGPGCSTKIKPIATTDAYELQHMRKNHRVLGLFIKSTVKGDKTCSTSLSTFLQKHRLSQLEAEQVCSKFNEVTKNGKWSTLVFYKYVQNHSDIYQEANAMQL